MHCMRTSFAALVLALGTALPGLARAESSAAADALWEEGRVLLDQGRVAEACSKLDESYRIDPGTGALILLAHCHEREGKLASAWSEYNEAAARARRERSREREQYAVEESSRLARRLSRVAIHVHPSTLALPGLTIRRGGLIVGRAALGVAIPVDGGRYEIRAEAPGYEAWVRVIQVEPEGDHVSVSVPELARLPVAPAAPPAPLGASEAPTWSVRRVGGVVSAGVGVLALGTAGYLVLRAFDEQDRSEHECGAAGCTKAGNELREKAGSFADASAVTAAAGAVLLGVGATLFFLPSSESARPQTGIRAVLVPGAGTIAVEGSF